MIGTQLFAGMCCLPRLCQRLLLGHLQPMALSVKAKLNNDPAKSTSSTAFRDSQERRALETIFRFHLPLVLGWQRPKLHVRAGPGSWALGLSKQQALRAGAPWGEGCISLQLPSSPGAPWVPKRCRKQHMAAPCCWQGWWDPWVCSHPTQYLMFFQWEKPPA